MPISENVRETIANSNIFLTNMVVRHKLRKPFADFVAPPFKVKLEAGKYLRYTEDIHRIFENKITGREKAPEIQWEATEETYACEEYGMSKFVSNKAKAQAIEPIKLEIEASMRLKMYQAQARAYRIWQIAGNAAIVTQGSGDLAAAWDTAAGTPVSDILDGIATIEDSIGVEPNKILIPTQVALKMIKTTEWKDYFRYTQVGFKNGLFNAVEGLRHLGLNPMVTNIQGLNTRKCTSSDPRAESMWGDTVLLFYSEDRPTTETMTFMYSPFVFMNVIARTVMKRERGVYLDIYEDIDELLIEPDCGYLFTNTI